MNNFQRQTYATIGAGGGAFLSLIGGWEATVAWFVVCLLLWVFLAFACGYITINKEGGEL